MSNLHILLLMNFKIFANVGDTVRSTYTLASQPNMAAKAGRALSEVAIVALQSLFAHG